VKNGEHRAGSLESTRLVNKELSDVWKLATPEGDSISEPFRPEELGAALRRLEPGKSPGLNSISSRSSYSTPDRLSNLGSATSSVPACAKSKFQRSGEEH